jgi:adenosylmethionine-8-amino-7-oxononanoate aminotransferase
MHNFDHDHIWHPYTSMTDPLPTYAVESASGVNIKLADGRQLIDGMSSWWCAIHGYNHPALNAAAEAQLGKMAHVMFGGLSHAPATRLAQQLIEITAPSLQYVFFSDSGSVSVEVAIKMALQYWHNLGLPNKKRLLTIRGGYHGDTFGAMSVCDPINGMHSLFAGVVQEQLFVPRPQTRFGEELIAGDTDPLREQLNAHHPEIAAIILEPIVQGAGSMWFYSAEYLHAVKELCEEFDILLIADEIATGFGRTGKLFACEHAAIEPDILCVGKALTGGYMSLAATISNDRVRDGISANSGILMHGPTFMANPLACSVAIASIDLLLNSPWQQRVRSIEQQLEGELAPCREMAGVTDVRVKGAIGVVEMKEPIDIVAVQSQLVEQGVWLRPFGKLIYTMPPYVISAQQLSRVTSAMCEVVAASSSHT